MADENENEFEEEFDFESEDDLLGTSGSEAEATTSSFDYGGESKKPPMPVLIGIGVAVVVVIGVIVMMFTGGKEEAPPPPPPEVQQPEPTPPPMQNAWDTTASPLAEGEKQITPKDVIDRLETQDENTKKYMIALDRKLNEFFSKLNSLEERLGASNKAVAEVSNKLEAISQEIQVMAAPPPPVEKPEDKKVEREAFVSPTLTIHAIIPGRAWLKTRDGRTITVTEGDPIEGYGKVLAIDAPANKVITSSGVVLR